MADILHKTFSISLFGLINYVFWLNFIPGITIENNPALVFDNGLAPNRLQAIIWIYAGLALRKKWPIYAPLGLNE